jgi:hypothetical protein
VTLSPTPAVLEAAAEPPSLPFSTVASSVVAAQPPAVAANAAHAVGGQADAASCAIKQPAGAVAVGDASDERDARVFCRSEPSDRKLIVRGPVVHAGGPNPPWSGGWTGHVSAEGERRIPRRKSKRMRVRT